MSVTFGQRFQQRAAQHGSLCVGMDPHAGILDAWGLEYNVDGLRRFTEICVAAFADTACVVKPQVAFYEAFGSAGFAVLEESIAALRQSGVLVISDAKRGDIGSTMAGYAQAWLGDGAPLESDAVTVSPWLGVDALQPVFELAERNNKGAIVLAATSNPEAPSVQQSHTTAGESLAQSVVDRVAELNAPHINPDGTGAGNVGVVVGATVAQPPILDKVGGMILMPGVGAQGGSMDDVRRIAGQAFNLASPNVSRGVLKHGPDIANLQAAVREFSEKLLK